MTYQNNQNQPSYGRRDILLAGLAAVAVSSIPFKGLSADSSGYNVSGYFKNKKLVAVVFDKKGGSNQKKI